MMTLAYLNISGPEIILIILYLFLIIGIGHYGRRTALGYEGTVLLALFATPFFAFALVYYLNYRSKIPS
ncbi:MAG: hypothetical protein Q8S11_05525 [Daejeonella sp.]|uniref:hypothetical protein n=1 Tax=Daejeonella sp. TaxID=2805397 RepID=UPI0027328BE9|nr:hypothetical protein [Daejeonella sp.]MDP3467772.1 hypothetical protein [Daejeonella sp.]